VPTTGWRSGLLTARRAGAKMPGAGWMKTSTLQSARPIRDVTVTDVENIVRAIAKKRGAASAHYARLLIAGVFKAQPHAVNLGNPARDAANVIEIPRGKPKGVPLAAKDIPAFLDAADRYPGRIATKLAIRLLMLTFTRKRELVEAPWTEIDLTDRPPGGGSDGRRRSGRRRSRFIAAGGPGRRAEGPARPLPGAACTRRSAGPRAGRRRGALRETRTRRRSGTFREPAFRRNEAAGTAGWLCFFSILLPEAGKMLTLLLMMTSPLCRSPV
jgi:integrase